MKILKIIGLVIAVIIAIPLIVALFVKKEYTVERSVTIDKPKSDVFNFVRYLKNQDRYSKWVNLDPAMKKEFRGTDGQPGFVYAWDGNSKAGQGEQEIKGIGDGRLDVEVRFIRPFESVAQAPMTTEELSPTQTRVKWAMKGKSSYPMNFMNLFMDGMIGGDLEEGLTNLKRVMEGS
jgi:hypothetical protein